MVLHLAERLDVPVARAQRAAARPRATRRPTPSVRSTTPRWRRHAPRSTASSRAHEPYPALVVDGAWNIVASNAAVALLLDGVAPHLLEPPANALRITLHPAGLAPRIVNLAEWSGHLIDRLARRAAITGDGELARLHAELLGYPGVQPSRRAATVPGGDRAAAAAPGRRRGSDLPERADDVRHGRRHHACGALARGVLPRGRAHGRGLSRTLTAYLTARTSSGRMSGSSASRSPATLPRASGIAPLEVGLPRLLRLERVEDAVGRARDPERVPGDRAFLGGGERAAALEERSELVALAGLCLQ